MRGREDEEGEAEEEDEEENRRGGSCDSELRTWTSWNLPKNKKRRGPPRPRAFWRGRPPRPWVSGAFAKCFKNHPLRPGETLDARPATECRYRYPLWSIPLYYTAFYYVSSYLLFCILLYYTISAERRKDMLHCTGT